MGEVYRVHDQRLRREVALKLLKNASSSEEALFYFHREARAAAALHHPGLVQIFDYSGPDEVPPFIVMELIEGGNLVDVLKPRFPIGERAVMAVINRVARALWSSPATCRS